MEVSFARHDQILRRWTWETDGCVACFSIGSGDVEDAPAPNALAKFDVYEKDGAVYIKGDETSIKFGQRDPVLKCQAVGDKRVVIIGG